MVAMPDEPVIMFSDYACPWCYLGRARLSRAIAEGGSEAARGRTTRLLPFPLSPDTPTTPGGRDIVAHLRARGLDVEAAMARLAPMMAAEGLEYPTALEGRRQYNTSRAQELALWAEATGTPEQLDALHDRLFRAYQVENLDVHDLGVLAQIAAEVGLDADAARAALEAGEFATAREQAWRVAMQAGVRSVPTYVSEGRGVVGAQPVEVLRELLEGQS